MTWQVEADAAQPPWWISIGGLEAWWLGHRYCCQWQWHRHEGSHHWAGLSQEGGVGKGDSRKEGAAAREPEEAAERRNVKCPTNFSPSETVCAVPKRNFTRSGVCSCENLKEHLPTLWRYTWNTSPRRLGPLIKVSEVAAPGCATYLYLLSQRNLYTREGSKDHQGEATERRHNVAGFSTGNGEMGRDTFR